MSGFWGFWAGSFESKVAGLVGFRVLGLVFIVQGMKTSWHRGSVGRILLRFRRSCNDLVQGVGVFGGSKRFSVECL